MKKISKNTRNVKKKKRKSNPGAGAPTKFRKEHHALFLAHCSLGGNVSTFAHSIGIHRDTVYEWKKSNREFSDTFKRGKQATFKWWYTLLQTSGMGKKIKGAAYGPNLGSIAFAMKNLCGWSDNPAEEEDEIDEVLFE